MEHVWSIICQSSSIDSETNRVSLFDIIEEVQFGSDAPDESILGLPLQVSFVTLWRRSDLDIAESGLQKTVIVGPSGEILIEQEQEIKLTQKSRRYRVRLNMNGIPYRGSGIYRFETFWHTDKEMEWQKAASIPIEITKHLTSEFE